MMLYIFHLHLLTLLTLKLTLLHIINDTAFTTLFLFNPVLIPITPTLRHLVTLIKQFLTHTEGCRWRVTLCYWQTALPTMGMLTSRYHQWLNVGVILFCLWVYPLLWTWYLYIVVSNNLNLILCLCQSYHLLLLSIIFRLFSLLCPPNIFLSHLIILCRPESHLILQ